MVGTALNLMYDELVRIWCYRWTALITAANDRIEMTVDIVNE